MGACSISDLFTFIQTTSGIQTVRSESFIYTNGVDDNLPLGGSNITIHCLQDYKNIGGPLTIICTEANIWTPFPNCISTLTTVATPVRCPVTSDTWIFTNGYMSDTTDALVYDDKTATGSVTVSCSPGYIIDTVSQGVFKCNDGTWSPRPFCIKTARCSLPTLNSFTSDPSATKGLDISSQQLSIDEDESDQILVDSYVQFICKKGYTNSDGNLNVKCNADGQWSAFPSCIAASTPKPSGNNNQ